MNRIKNGIKDEIYQRKYLLGNVIYTVNIQQKVNYTTQYLLIYLLFINECLSQFSSLLTEDVLQAFHR